MRERFSALFEEFTEPTVAYEHVDTDAVIREVNEAFEETFGYGAETAVGTPIHDLVVPSDRLKEAERIDQRARAGESIDREVLRKTAAGERYFHLRNIPVSVEDGIDGYAVYSDIHERKRHEQALERKNERLSQFVSIVSHELRNPLNVASSRLTLAREDCDSDHLDYVDGAHDRIGSIIDDTLTLARQGKSVDEVGVVNLPTVAWQCWNSVRTCDADLEVGAERLLRADPDRLRSVLANLFENAVEHGGRAAAVTVDTIDGDGGAGFYVADDGPGFPGDREDLFEPGTSTLDDGTGFGLTIVRDLAEAHSWEVTATESGAGGARVEITGVEVVE